MGLTVPGLFRPWNLDHMEVRIVKKNRMKKLNLNRETLRTLDDSSLSVKGGYAIVQQPQPITDTQTISICKYCTTPLDNCPDPSVAVAIA